MPIVSPQCSWVRQCIAADHSILCLSQPILFSQSRRHSRHHPPHHLAAEDVITPLPGPLQPGYPRSRLGWGLLTVPASGSGMAPLVASLQFASRIRYMVRTANSGLYPAGPHRGPKCSRSRIGGILPEVTFGGWPPAADAGTEQPRPHAAAAIWDLLGRCQVVVSLVRALEDIPSSVETFFWISMTVSACSSFLRSRRLSRSLSDALVSGVLRPGFPSSLRRTPATGPRHRVAVARRSSSSHTDPPGAVMPPVRPAGCTGPFPHDPALVGGAEPSPCLRILPDPVCPHSDQPLRQPLLESVLSTNTGCLPSRPCSLI